MVVRGSTPNVPHISLGDSRKILTPFGPMIYQTFLNDESIDKLLYEGSRLTKESNDWADQLAGNFVRGRSLSYSDAFRNDFSSIIMNEVEAFRNAANQAMGEVFPQGNMELLSLWINYQKQYDFNPNHIHSNYLSFVIYCDVPESIFDQQADCNLPLAGNVSFMYGESMILSNQTFNVKPMNNLMFIFPATLRHIVYPFYSDDTRVSVSGNIDFVKEA